MYRITAAFSALWSKITENSFFTVKEIFQFTVLCKKKCFFLYNLLSPVLSHIQTNITTKGKESFPSFPWEHHTVCRAVKAKEQCPKDCPVSLSDSDSVEVKVVYGVEGNSTFLECVPRSSQAELRWTLQVSDSQQQTVGQTHESREVSLLLCFHIKSIQVFTDVDSRVFLSLLWLIHQKHYHDFSLWIFPLNVLLPLVLFIYIFSPAPPKDKTLTDIIFWLNLSKQKQCISERLCFCLTKIGRLKDV